MAKTPGGEARSRNGTDKERENMCGIMAYVGPQQALPVVLEGLRRLEYRGYDSAGVAVLPGLDSTVQSGGTAPTVQSGGTAPVEIRRAPGKLDRLVEAVTVEHAHGSLSGSVAIGHTRWATHGLPTEQNAHPHSDCTGAAVVAHNGIVENYDVLKAHLQAEGHQFTSDTDTEVIAHLIERAIASGADFPEATRLALGEIRGANAVTAVHASWPSIIIAGRTGHAGGVVVGQGNGEMFVASDLPAILDRTRRVIYLESGEMAIVSATGAQFYQLDGTSVERSYQTVPYDPMAAAKGGYRHFMLKEIHEQPRALLDTLQGRLQAHAPWVRLEDLSLTPEDVRQIKRIVIVACGTAWHAGLVGKFLIEEIAGISVEVDYASEFRYRRPLLDEHTLVIAISQSGETADTLVSMDAAREAGARVLGVVNVMGSAAARLASKSAGVLYTRAGPEIGVASTKAFTCQVAALALLALFLGGSRGALAETDALGLVKALEALPEKAAETLGHVQEVDPIHQPPTGMVDLYEGLASKYHQAKDFLYIGRGNQYPIALEGALKLKEISYIHAEGYPAGEMKHGPIALIDRDVPIVAIALRDGVYEKMISNVQEAKAREGRVIAIASEGDTAIHSKADHVLTVRETDPRLAPILTTLPLQLLSYYIAVRRGCDVDQPRNLAKSVTVE
ncbi:MAG TPA: glutamine--fructose-6-phosphate transaminase (isomerizing) [Chloroflexota bacterium]|nr:glutamine--fructose-6-phosphate transaminase (isomerizing) [Chloroflexota bacterium]